MTESTTDNFLFTRFILCIVSWRKLESNGDREDGCHLVDRQPITTCWLVSLRNLAVARRLDSFYSSFKQRKQINDRMAPPLESN